jgi:hypothetical protein
MDYGLKFRLLTKLGINSVKKNQKALVNFKNFSSACCSVINIFRKEKIDFSNIVNT